VAGINSSKGSWDGRSVLQQIEVLMTGHRIETLPSTTAMPGSGPAF
jgi:hypothetical protein